MDGGSVVLFPSMDALAEHVAAHAARTFGGVENYQELIDAFPGSVSHGPADQDVDTIDFVAANRGLSRGKSVPKKKHGKILDCLNAAKDLATQTADSPTIFKLRNPGSPLAQLNDFLWGKVSDIPLAQVNDEFAAMTSWFAGRTQLGGSE